MLHSCTFAPCHTAAVELSDGVYKLVPLRAEDANSEWATASVAFGL